MFTAVIAVFAGILFGLAPAVNAFRSAPALSLREIKGAGETRLRRLFGKGLVAAQVALSVVLLSGAALFLCHMSNLENLNLGFRRDHLLLVTLDPARSGYSAAGLSNAYRELLARFEAIPGVGSVSLCAPTPISGAGASRFLNVRRHEEKREDCACPLG
jgi:hypothetical protein